MEKIAIISDIHSNLEALKTVLKDIDEKNIKRIFCLGDIISKGIHSHECVNIIKEKCEIVLLGNCDYIFSLDECFKPDIEIEQKRFDWNRSLLKNDDIEFLKKLQYSFEFYMSGSYIRLLHSTPYTFYEAITNLDNVNKKLTMFESSDRTITNKNADIVIYGHTHSQFLDRFCNKTLINVGSVGNAIEVIQKDDKNSTEKETTNAFYLIIEGNYGSKEYDSNLSFSFVRIPYDIDEELNNDVDNIEKEEYISEVRHGKYRDMKKIDKYFKDRNILI